MSILAAASNSGDTDLANTAFALVFVIVIGGLLAYAIFRGATWFGRSDVNVTGTLRHEHEHSGTLHHEVTGGYRVEHTGGYQVEHTGSVEMRLAQEDRDRLDRLAADRQPRMVVPPPTPVVLSRDDRQPAVYRTASPQLPPPRPSQVLDRRPSWPEIEP